mmetsp:Transcript_31592/g.107115  ORF Transcript_31592/g.107115 Transcript_31592/m.107115 type:complete len:217 (+) Transcript_31592:104-754(+)
MAAPPSPSPPVTLSARQSRRSVGMSRASAWSTMRFVSDAKPAKRSRSSDGSTASTSRAAASAPGGTARTTASKGPRPPTKRSGPTSRTSAPSASSDPCASAASSAATDGRTRTTSREPRARRQPARPSPRPRAYARMGPAGKRSSVRFEQDSTQESWPSKARTHAFDAASKPRSAFQAPQDRAPSPSRASRSAASKRRAGAQRPRSSRKFATRDAE